MPDIFECKAPDISNLGATLIARATVGFVFHGREQPESQIASRLLTGYLLTVDKAVREFMAGREALSAYAKSSNVMDLMLDGLGRFENCINATKRAFRYIERMTAHPESPTIDRTLRRFLQNWERTLTPIRDAIEHIDGDIAADEILVNGMAHLLAIERDGEHLQISVHRLSLVDLATVVSNLHRAGCKLIESLPPHSQVEVPSA